MKITLKHKALALAVASALGGMLALSGNAFAARPPDAGGGGGGPPTGGESGVNNLSFPVILSDNVGPAAFPADGVWRWASISSPETECALETNTVSPVPTTILCYCGRKVTVVSETGEVQFTEPTKVWWLQKRTQNFWKALSIGHDISTPLVVSAVDIGDLLESSPSIATRQIRVEFNLLQSVDQTDPELGQYVGLEKCVAPPAAAPYSIGCFAAFGMSGAVPGTEQSGNEMQGNDFGPGPEPGELTGTLTLLDPATVRLTEPDVGGIEALVYSRCARLLIQKIGGGVVAWDKTTGQWAGTTVSAPLVNLPAYTNAWSTEITSGGSIVYGYNWNAKTASTGLYRLTFVLDGNDAEGPVCTTPLATRFVADDTQLVNLGENNTSTSIVYAGDADLGDEGGIAYIDLNLTAKGGGGGGGGKPPNAGE
jgi:hypothetical protein